MIIDPKKSAADRRADMVVPIIGLAFLALIALWIFITFHFIVKFW